MFRISLPPTWRRWLCSVYWRQCTLYMQEHIRSLIMTIYFPGDPHGDLEWICPPHFCHKLFLRLMHIRWVFFTVKGADGSRSRSVLDSPVCKIRRMRLIWCFRGASKSWKVFSFMLLRPPPDTRPLTRGSWCPGLRQGSSQIPVTGSRSSLRGNFCVQPTFFDLAALLGAQKKIPFVLPHEIRSYM